MNKKANRLTHGARLNISLLLYIRLLLLLLLFGGGRDLNPGPCIFYALSIPIELSSQDCYYFTNNLIKLNSTKSPKM